MLKCSSPTQLPTLDMRKSEGVFLYPITNASLLLGCRDLRISGMTTFWRSPYNEVIKYTGVTYKRQHPSRDHRRSTFSKPHGEVKGILKNRYGGRDSASDTSSEDLKKIRGILSRGSQGTGEKRGRSAKKVQFDDKLVRLYEIGRRHGYTSSGESVSGDEFDETPKSSRLVSYREPVGYRTKIILEMPKMHEEESKVSRDSRILTRSASAIDLTTPVGNGQSLPKCSSFNSRGTTDKWTGLGSRVSSDSSQIPEEEKQRITLKPRTPRLCRSFTSPLLFSQRSLGKKSAPSAVIFRHIQPPESSSSVEKMQKGHFRNGVHTSRSAGPVRVQCHTPSIQTSYSDVSPALSNSRINFCNDDKTGQIMQWLKGVNDRQSKEGRCTVLLPTTNEQRNT